jgi:hypothetical protein
MARSFKNILKRSEKTFVKNAEVATTDPLLPFVVDRVTELYQNN